MRGLAGAAPGVVWIAGLALASASPAAARLVSEKGDLAYRLDAERA